MSVELPEPSASDAVFSAQRDLILNQRSQIEVLLVANTRLERNYLQATDRVVALDQARTSWQELANEQDENLERLRLLLTEARNYLHHVYGPGRNQDEGGGGGPGVHLDPCLGCEIEARIDSELCSTTNA